MTKKYFNRWTIGVALIIIGAAIIRFIYLDPKPLHHDESIHAYYSWLLFTKGTYEYHPLSHGPLLYYLISLSFHIFGVSDASARVMPALFGTGLVALFLLLRQHLSKKAIILLMVIAATSPMLVYVSRFARHDMISLFCTLLLIISTLNYLLKPRPVWVYLIVLSLAVSFANHELTYLTLLIWLVATGITLATVKNKSELWLYFKNRDLWHFLLAVVIGLYLIVAFYSSFGHFGEGLKRALPNPKNPDSAIGYWIAQQGVHRGSQPFYFYLLMLPLYEIVPFVLGTIGAVIGLFSRNFAWRFVAIFAILTLLIYSLAGEKMPWLTVHPLLPLILTTGFFFDWIWHKISKRPKLIFAMLVWTLLLFTAYNAYRLAFLNPSNPKELAVYVQTQPIVKNLAKTIEETKPQPSVTLGYDVAWPLVWYLRDVPYVYSQNVQETPTNIGLFSLDESYSLSNSQAYPEQTRYPFRSWWVPADGWPGFKKMAAYYFLRQEWNEQGSYDFMYLQQNQTLPSP